MGKQTRCRYVARTPVIALPPFDTRSLLNTAIHLLGVTGIRQGTPDFQDPSFGRNAYNSERPLNVEPTNQGGVAINGHEGLPEGHANMADKMIGKMQKVNCLVVSSACPSLTQSARWQVTGKYLNKPELHEKGELRESGGKLAVTGEARAPHD